MLHTNQLDQLQVIFSRLHNLSHEWNKCLVELDQTLERLVLDSESNAVSSPKQTLRILQESHTVVYRGQACRFGPTTPFRLLARLARRPNQYFTYDQLIEDVWDGEPRTEAAIRSAIRQLRICLRDAEMGALASAIHGQSRCYGLMLDHLSEE